MQSGHTVDPGTGSVLDARRRLRRLAGRLARSKVEADLLVRSAVTLASSHGIRCSGNDVAPTDRTTLYRCLFATWCCRSVPGAEQILCPSPDRGTALWMRTSTRRTSGARRVMPGTMRERRVDGSPVVERSGGDGRRRFAPVSAAPRLGRVGE